MADVEKIICEGCKKEITKKIGFGNGFSFICDNCDAITFCEKDGSDQYCLKGSSAKKLGAIAQ